VARLVELLREAGYQPGVISRGYGGQSPHWPRQVMADSDPREVGDEPVLLARRCRCPVVVDPDRVAAAQALLASKIAMSSSATMACSITACAATLKLRSWTAFAAGQRACLPAGPLREPPSRLREVDFVVGNGAARGREYLMCLRGDTALNLAIPVSAPRWPGFATARFTPWPGIGDPGRFFDHLRRPDCG
jgi:tetraacyldisaccharide 4'-kinase